jgi:hypothetical protein
MAEETKQNDSIIELTDVVEDGDEAEDVLSDDILSEDEISEDSPIELTDMDDFSGFEMDAESDFEEIGMDDPAQDEASGDSPVSDNEDAAEQTLVFQETPVTDEAPEIDEMSVSEAQIEAALERIIEKKFAEKIEPLLFDTMERVILQEIQKIKTALLKDMDRIGPF